MSQPMTTDEAQTRFGVDPRTIGVRHRGWSVIDVPDEEDLLVGAQPGWLRVSARDGGENDRDDDVDAIPTFAGDLESMDDGTYRHYYFQPVAQ